MSKYNLILDTTQPKSLDTLHFYILPQNRLQLKSILISQHFDAKMQYTNTIVFNETYQDWFILNLLKQRVNISLNLALLIHGMRRKLDFSIKRINASSFQGDKNKEPFYPSRPSMLFWDYVPVLISMTSPPPYR